MFRIKICGITSVADARSVAAAGADAVGLNFYPKSPRCINAPDLARQIIDAMPSAVVKVGLFVNAAIEDVCERFDRLGLDLIQLHGDEPPEFIAELAGRPVMRAFRLDSEHLAQTIEYLQRCRQLGCDPRMILADSLIQGKYGGTGKLVDWTVLHEFQATEGIPPLMLAGGLRPENVAEAIRTVRPAAVDTASGVESSPGRKDPAAVEAFVRAARDAFGGL